MSSTDGKIMVIGVDGAPFDVISKWAEDGVLPHRKEAIEKRTLGALRFSFVPTNPIAWTSIVANKNPGKYNIFDWGYIVV
jgi:predicted AlkP superfamily phosphohydrolase/phosphomutase